MPGMLWLLARLDGIHCVMYAFCPYIYIKGRQGNPSYPYTPVFIRLAKHPDSRLDTVIDGSVHLQGIPLRSRAAAAAAAWQRQQQCGGSSISCVNLSGKAIAHSGTVAAASE